MKQKVPDDKLKKIAFDGLKYFKSICEEKGIRYYLAYGTLIGAVRHQGFIPWDDDIDVWVPRNDYDYLISLSDDIENDQWQLLSHDKEKRYLFPWAKLCHKGTVITPSRFENGFIYGISIDIFPLDDCPDNIENIDSAKDYSKRLCSKLTSIIHEYSPYTGGIHGLQNAVVMIKKKIKYILRNGEFRFPMEMNKILNDSAKLYESSSFVHSVLSLDNMAYPKEAFQEQLMYKFEDDQFTVPKGYDVLLKLYYGDYMKLPPLEKRVSNHTFVAYYIN